MDKITKGTDTPCIVCKGDINITCTHERQRIGSSLVVGGANPARTILGHIFSCSGCGLVYEPTAKNKLRTIQVNLLYSVLEGFAKVTLVRSVESHEIIPVGDGVPVPEGGLDKDLFWIQELPRDRSSLLKSPSAGYMLTIPGAQARFLTHEEYPTNSFDAALHTRQEQEQQKISEIREKQGFDKAYAHASKLGLAISIKRTSSAIETEMRPDEKCGLAFEWGWDSAKKLGIKSSDYAFPTGACEGLRVGILGDAPDFSITSYVIPKALVSHK